MGSSNLALYIWYLIPAIIGAIMYKKNKWIGALIGLGVALVSITIFALLMGP